jgi:SAM-dependent methyltransferase
MGRMSTRWEGSDAPRGATYDAQWERLAAAGHSVHGEADLVDALLQEHGGRRVLDAGCGTGRVAIELAARGYDVVGTDLDPAMLDAARAKAPALPWVHADLATVTPEDVGLGADGGERGVGGFDAVVMAGNVMIFVEPGTEGPVLTRLHDLLEPGGLVIAGFQLRPDRVALAEYDRLAAAVGLEPVARWSTWERAPYAGGDYAVSVHRRAR